MAKYCYSYFVKIKYLAEWHLWPDRCSALLHRTKVNYKHFAKLTL